MTRETTRITGTISVPGQQGEATLYTVRGEETLSRAFVYQADATIDGLAIDEARGHIAHIELHDELGNERHVSGAIDRIELLAADEDAIRYRLFLVPFPSLLRYRHGFRIFQELSVPDIVRKVFESAGVASELVEWNLTGSYAAREYCVQYDENEWDFICRLLESEGIWFRWEHDANGHRMIVEDDSENVPAFSASTLRFHLGAMGRHGSEAGVYDWKATTRVAENKASLNDYDRLHPSLDLKAEATAEDPGNREWYEYPGGYETPDEGKRLASARLDELRARCKTASARTDAIFLVPGGRFELLDHPFVSGEFVVTSTQLHAQLREETLPGPLTEVGPVQAEVRFEVIPRATKFRAARLTPKPRVMGLQTARVSGPSGEEIHCDEHGRVKLQFHWDVDGQLDEHVSCFMRVSQQHTTGSVAIPRIGWEVLVSFHEGDPDRPVCLGRLYNPLNPPDFPLPASKTMTAHRSSSSPGAGAVNEVVMDDTAGSQAVRVNAGYDMNVNAANDKKFSTTKNLTRKVGANRAAKVGGNEKASVQGSASCAVGGASTVKVGAMRETKVSGVAFESAVGSISLHVGGMENMQIGSPSAAVLEIITTTAISAATGAAAQAAGRAQAALLGPIAPALNAARSAIGPAAQFAGPAAAMLAPGDPTAAVFGSTLGSLSNAAGAADGGQIAAGMAGAIASGALARAGLSPAGSGTAAAHGNGAGASNGAGGGGAGGGGAGGGGAGGGGAGGGGAGGGGAGGGGGGGGSGVWGTTVGGSVSESIGALAAINSAFGVSFGIAGSSTETIGAARLEAIIGGKSESSASKIETVGVYMVQTGQAIAIDAQGAIAINVASQTQNIAKAHAVNAGAAGVVTAASMTLDASDKITLVCGAAEVVIESGGIAVKGALSVTVEGTKKIKLAPSAIAP